MSFRENEKRASPAPNSYFKSQSRGGSRGGVEGVATPPLSSILIFFNSSLKKIRTKLSFTKLFHFHHSPAFADLKR